MDHRIILRFLGILASVAVLASCSASLTKTSKPKPQCPGTDVLTLNKTFVESAHGPSEPVNSDQLLQSALAKGDADCQKALAKWEPRKCKSPCKFSKFMNGNGYTQLGTTTKNGTVTVQVSKWCNFKRDCQP